MKRYLILIIILFLASCSKDSPISNNPFLPNYSFSIDLNTNLPSYSQLQFASNPILITTPGIGVKGIIVMKVGEGDYRAFEASCPNQVPSDCSLLTINGINAICPCDDKEYSLFTGLGNGPQTLKPYRVEVLGTVVRVSN